MARTEANIGRRRTLKDEYPIVIKNVSGVVIPPFALLSPTATSGLPVNEASLVSVGKGTAGSPMLFNGPLPIKVGKKGRGRCSAPAVVMADAGGVGQKLGPNPLSPSFTATSEGEGLVAWGGLEDGLAGVQFSASASVTIDNFFGDCGIVVTVETEGEEIGTHIAIDTADIIGSGLTTVDETCRIMLLLGCGLKFNEVLAANAVEVDIAALAGRGLQQGTLESPETGPACNFELKLGCGLNFDGDGAVEVSVSQLAGTGLTTEEGVGGCLRLAIDPEAITGLIAGCGILIVEGEIQFDASQAAGHGLIANEESGACQLALNLCAVGGLELDAGNGFCLQVKVGCGIELSLTGEVQVKLQSSNSYLTCDPGDGLSVDRVALAADLADGETITAADGVLSAVGGGGGSLTAGCGIYIDEEGVVSVNVAALDGLGLHTNTSEGACELEVCLVADGGLEFESSGPETGCIKANLKTMLEQLTGWTESGAIMLGAVDGELQLFPTTETCCVGLED